jgi:hypothetical protein
MSGRQPTMMTQTITIKTRLDSGIYRSSGGGETVTVWERTIGPRNLLKAITFLHESRRLSRRDYGDIGAGRTWMEIGGREVGDEYALLFIESDDEPHYPGDRPRSRTARARDYLAWAATASDQEFTGGAEPAPWWWPAA